MTSLTALSLQIQNASFTETVFPPGLSGVLRQAGAAGAGEGSGAARVESPAAAGPAARTGCLALVFPVEGEPELGPNGIERVIQAANRAYRASCSPEQLPGAQISRG